VKANDDDDKERTILFEDEAFQKQRDGTAIDFDQFQAMLEDFISEDSEAVAIDTTNEFDLNKEGKEDYDNLIMDDTAESHVDLFRDNLSQTIKQYEHLLFIDNYKEDGERQMT
jgi:hypothetical protein